MHEAAWTRLEQFDRIDLAHLPTPLEPLDRLSEELGGPRIWMKRDDCTGLATGGNKTRKLEYLLADAQRLGADTIITFGAIQSNHARQTAAACAKRGIDCHLILARKVNWQHPDYDRLGNVLLDRLVGATLHIVEVDEVADRYRKLMRNLESTGQRPYVIPTGGSNAIGALGYARCALELLDQTRAQDIDLTTIFHASSSAGTQSGLLLGFALADFAIDVQGVNVSEPDPLAIAQDIVKITGAAHEQWDLPEIDDASIHVDHRYLGEGYGFPTEATVSAVKLVAELEGIVLDTVYSGKAMSGLIDQIVLGDLHGQDVVFIHTGGVASLPVYDTLFDER